MRQVGKWLLLCLLFSPLGRTEGVLGAKGMSLAFFSSSTSEVLCRLKADTISPATRRRGPFIMPAAGFDLRNPRMELSGLKCEAGDWELLLKTLAAWERMSSPTGFLVTLPDGRAVALSAMPQVRAGRLIAPLGDGKRRTGLLSIEHDGADGLRVKLLGAPAPTASVARQADGSNLVN